MESPSELIALVNDGLACTAGFDPKLPDGAPLEQSFEIR